MPGLWRYNESTPEGKFLVQRRDGSVPSWPWMVLGAKDPAAPAALRAYALECERLRFDQEYVEDIKRLAEEFMAWQAVYGDGDPTEPPHGDANPGVRSAMLAARSAGGGSA